MSSRHSKRKKKCRDKLYSENEIKNMSEVDKEELELLDIQEQSIGILLYSDLNFYINVMQNIKILLEQDDDKTERIKKIIKSLYTFYQFAAAGFIGMSFIFLVDITRYRNLVKRHKKGEINYSESPELYIAIGGLFQILCYKYFLVATVKFYNRALCDFYYIYNANSNLLLKICYFMKKASIIRIAADSYFYQSTIASKEVIFNKYKKNKLKTENPDSLLLQGAILYFSSRVMIAQANIGILNEVFKDTDSDLREIYLIPNKLMVIGNIYGAIGNAFAIHGIVEMYKRDFNGPVFGI